MGFAVPEGDSPIIPVLIGEDLLTLSAGKRLFDEGIYLNSVLFPAVPKGEGILRISLTAIHSQEDIELLLRGFSKLQQSLDNRIAQSFLRAKVGAQYVKHELRSRLSWR